MELNPKHRMTKAMHDHWHKLLAIVMAKQGLNHVTIGSDDLKLLQDGNQCIVVKDGENGDGLIHLRLVSMEEGERLAKQEAGND